MNRLRQQRDALARIVAAIEAEIAPAGLTLEDVIHYLHYVEEKNDALVTEAEEAPSKTWTMADALPNSKNATHSDAPSFVDYLHGEIEDAGAKWDPDFKIPLRTILKRDEAARKLIASRRAAEVTDD
jgi:hypothetical protein